MEPIVVSRTTDGTLLKVNVVRPSNFHAHLRAEALMRAISYSIMCWVKYLLCMPNTGPIDTIEKVVTYYYLLCEQRDRYGFKVEFVMTIYVTDKLDWRMVEALANLPFRCEVKWYPAHKGATTGSGHGIPLEDIHPDTYRALADSRIPFLGHLESVCDRNGRELPPVEREDYFMEHEWPWLREEHPDLRICIEHASTAAAIARVKEDASSRTVCGITPHHMLLTIDDLMGYSWRNHGRCMPIPKKYDDMMACREFGTSGDFRAILGDDSAGHLSRTKVDMPFDQAACGCWLPHSLALYTLAFEKARALDERFVRFACYNGADWRGLPRPAGGDRVMVVRETEHDMPDPTPVPEANDVVIPLGWTEQEDRWRIGLAQQLFAV